VLQSNEPRGIANCLWALAALLAEGRPAPQGLRAAAATPVAEFGSQGLSNTFWSCAILAIGHFAVLSIAMVAVMPGTESAAA